jgi:two-component system sensor histidine kinase/response regulator
VTMDVAMHGYSQPSFVVLSIVMAILSAYAALDLAGRVASSRTASSRFAWLVCGSIAMGIGIWSMHYIGMLGYRMSMPVLYDWPTVLVSMLAAILASALALWIVSRRTLTFGATVLGSIFMGGGIAAMHYIGMAAMRMPASDLYSTPLVVASIVAAIVIAFAALRLTFAYRYTTKSLSWGKIASALLMGCAIPVMHYLGMAAVSFVPAELPPSTLRHAVNISGLGTASIALVTILLLSLVYLSAFIDRRFNLHAEALESSEERYRRIISSAFDAFIGIDSDGTVMDWNDQAAQTFGWTVDQAIGKPVGQLLQFNGAGESGSANFAELAASGDTRLHGRLEVTAQHKTGMLFPAEVAVSEITVGEKRMFAAFVHDVTERKLAERSMEEARTTAEAASQAKSEFLANMSHEIRTPLNGVIGMTDLALETELSREQREYMTTVKFSADSLLTVINDILDFSKIEAGRVDLETIRFDLRECIETTLKTLALRADEKGLELLCDIGLDVPEVVLGDPSRLRQIVVNLIGNAIKFTSTGEVSLRVTMAEASEGMDQLHFMVSDTGIGIAPEKLDSIFDSFSQADTSTTRQYGGTGLGLTISKRLADLMGGRIWCASTLGTGSQFNFVVPLPPAQPEALPAPSSSTPAQLLQGVKVLIVDDNKTNRRILEGLLRLWGMNTSSAAEGEVALRMLMEAEDEGHPYRLLLSDMHMPKMDGFMVVQEMRNGTGLSLPTVMMLSSGGHHGDASRCQQLGIAAYLLKPVRRDELQEAIARALGMLPTATKDNTMITKSTLLAGRPADQFLNILLAEDNEVNQKLAMRMLQKRGHRVVLAVNGREAVEATERGHYDLVLMDVQMPEMDGIQATLTIRAREVGTGHHLPIVAMTALVMKGDRERCLAADMDGYLSKPIRPQELDATLELYTAKKGETARMNANAAQDDDSVVDVPDLLERIDGDLEFVAELAQTFELDYPDKMKAVHAAVARGDGEGLRQTAHGLKGALANLAAIHAADLAAQLEQAGNENNMTHVPVLIQQLEKELPRVTAALQQVCAESV